MPLAKPFIMYGIHSVTPYNKKTRKPIAFLRVLGEASLNLSGEFAELSGGSALYPYDAEPSKISSEMSFTAREYPIAMMERLLAGETTEYTPNVSGEIAEFDNVNGSSVKSATTGIATIDIDDPDELKEGEYVIIATAAQAVKVYAMTNVNFSRGTALVIAEDMEIASGSIASDLAIPNLGITLSKGSGTIAVTPGDSASFFIKRPDMSSVSMLVGSEGSVFEEFGAYIVGQQKSDGQIVMIDAFNIRAAGMPLGFKEKGFSEWQINMKVLYDSDKNGTFRFISSFAA